MRPLRARHPAALLLVACLTLAPPVRGQSISGIVRDRTTRAPLTHVSVAIVADDSAATPVKLVPVAQTNDAGEFELRDVPTGRYRLRFSTGKDEIGGAGPYVITPDSDLQRVYLLDLPEQRTYFEFQVEKQVEPLAGFTAPRYPDDARAERLEGSVLVQFVVDTTGRVVMSTLHILRSTDQRFTAAVRAALPTMRFQPAEIAGRKVKQLVQQPFEFSLGR